MTDPDDTALDGWMAEQRAALEADLASTLDVDAGLAEILEGKR